MTENQQNLQLIFNAGVAAVDPFQAVLNTVRVEHNTLHIGNGIFNLNTYDRILVVGGGKAAAPMALAIESRLGQKIAAGLIVVKHGHTRALSIVEQVESSHPVPAEAGVAATLRILELVRAADQYTLIICLLSGGASALLVAPVNGLTLHDKQGVTRLLLHRGASINELNAVRKHLSMVKGGGLAQAACPAQVVSLILSDVIGDPLDTIASGPTAADYSTFSVAWAVIMKYGLQQQLSSRVVAYLQQGLAGQAPETLKDGDSCLDNVHNLIVANIHQALTAADKQAGQLGYTTRIASASLQGEAREAAWSLAQTATAELALMAPGERRCLLWGGETTVTVNGSGAGGRNQELALAFAIEIDGMRGVSMLSVGTDGSDGANDAAGAMVDDMTLCLALKHGITPHLYLQDNNSYNFFKQLDEQSGSHYHFKSGPTATNVMDMQIVLLNKI